MPSETPRTWTLHYAVEDSPHGSLNAIVSGPCIGPEDPFVEVIEKAPVDAERERMLETAMRASELAERYGATLIAISEALSSDGLSDRGRIMRARAVMAGLLPKEER
jgi:hypothetical protein